MDDSTNLTRATAYSQEREALLELFRRRPWVEQGIHTPAMRPVPAEAATWDDVADVRETVAATRVFLAGQDLAHAIGLSTVEPYEPDPEPDHRPLCDQHDEHLSALFALEDSQPQVVEPATIGRFLARDPARVTPAQVAEIAYVACEAEFRALLARRGGR